MIVIQSIYTSAASCAASSSRSSSRKGLNGRGISVNDTYTLLPSALRTSKQPLRGFSGLMENPTPSPLSAVTALMRLFARVLNTPQDLLGFEVGVEVGVEVGRVLSLLVHPTSAR